MITTKLTSMFRNERTAPFLSFIIGIGLAIMMFHRPILTVATLGLPVHEIHGKVVKHGDKCYKYFADDIQCEISGSK